MGMDEKGKKGKKISNGFHFISIWKKKKGIRSGERGCFFKIVRRSKPFLHFV